MQTESAPTWFTVSNGKVDVRCPCCHSQNVSYHKERVAGLQGISRVAKGLTPACLDCGKNLPQQNPKNQKQNQPRIISFRRT